MDLLPYLNMTEYVINLPNSLVSIVTSDAVNISLFSSCSTHLDTENYIQSSEFTWKTWIATLRKLPPLKKIQGQCTNSKLYDRKETEYIRWISVELQGYMKIQLLEPGWETLWYCMGINLKTSSDSSISVTCDMQLHTQKESPDAAHHLQHPWSWLVQDEVKLWHVLYHTIPGRRWGSSRLSPDPCRPRENVALLTKFRFKRSSVMGGVKSSFPLFCFS